MKTKTPQDVFESFKKNLAEGKKYTKAVLLLEEEIVHYDEGPIGASISTSITHSGYLNDDEAEEMLTRHRNILNRQKGLAEWGF